MLQFYQILPLLVVYWQQAYGADAKGMNHSTLFPQFFSSADDADELGWSLIEIGVPGTECLFGGICSGGSICIDILCLCVDGQRESKGQCVEKAVYDRQLKESELPQDEKPTRLPTIGLAGHPCGQGGVCRPSTKCIEGTCKCRQGYNPSFGECIRDLNVPRHIPREFIPNHRSIIRFPA